MSDELNVARLEDACRATLLFHGSDPWTAEKQRNWLLLTGKPEATTKVLCDLVRAALRPLPAAVGEQG